MLLIVQPPAGKLGGEAGILAFFADGQRKLAFRHHDHGGAVVLVGHNLHDFGGAEGVGDKALQVPVPADHVYLFALKLVDDVLNAVAPHSDAGADGVHPVLQGYDGDLAARAGLPGDRADFNDAVVDFRHLQLKEPAEELGVAAGDDDFADRGGCG